MTRLLIIQTGDAVSSAKGDFDQWFKRFAPPHCQTQTVKVHYGEKLTAKLKQSTDKIIITGSPSMITERQDWMSQTQDWLQSAIETIPTLGVCFGHQMLADLLGGKVAYNPNGRNMGLDCCTPKQAAQQDPLFKQLPSQGFNTFVSHSQSLQSELPQSVILATSRKDPNHAFRYKNHVWGVQFHPEWSQSIMQAYIEARKTALEQEGFCPSAMIQQLQPCPQAAKIITSFIGLNCQ